MSALKTAIQSFIDAQGGSASFYFTPIEGVYVMRSLEEPPPQHGIYRPALCVVAQGAKQITLGDRIFDYDEGAALVVSIELPAFGRVTKASPASPYLGLTIEFDVGVMLEVLEQLEEPPRPAADGPGIFVERLSAPLRDCVLRLAQLLATPGAARILYPSLMKELCYWLLTGPNGAEVCKIVRSDSHTRRIADAIRLLRRNFTRQVLVEEMAEAARMSPSSFHHHFKALTSLTPLQFQKQLRLLEARRLMVADAANVTSAALRVGYESPSQFSREYARMFGTPPKRDAETLKARVALRQD